MLASRRFLAMFIAVSLGSFSCDLVHHNQLGRTPDVAAAPGTDPEVAAVSAALRERHTGLRPDAIERVAQTIVLEAHRVGFTPRFVLAVIHVESSGYAYAMSEVGALGLMQLLPATAEALAPSLGIEWTGPDTLFDPVKNVRLGVAYLHELVGRFEDTSVALAAYNWGPTAIAERLRAGRDIPREYVRRVEAAYLNPTRARGLRI